MFSEMSGIPVFKQQIPRIIRSIFTPAVLALYKASMIAGSQSEFIFATILAGFPFFAFSVSLPINARKQSFNQIGATINLFHAGGSEYPDNILNTAVASSPIASLQVSKPVSVYNFAVTSL